MTVVSSGTRPVGNTKLADGRTDKTWAEDVKRELGLTDDKVPWWAVALLDLAPRTPEHMVRRMMQRGQEPAVSKPEFWATWKRVVNMARERIQPFDVATWVERCDEDDALRKVVQDAALSCPRALCQFIDLRDDQGLPWVLKAFHILMIRDIREAALSIGLYPYEHGKSANVNILVPLLDWGEDPEASQARIFLTDNFIRDWSDKLKQIVEKNERLHRVFPWIRKPVRGDETYGLWGIRRWAIGGKRLRSPSWEGFTVKQGVTGARHWRVVADDWVNKDNSNSLVDQDRMHDYVTNGAVTMRKEIVGRRSRHGTRWGTFGMVGTIYHRQDVNSRMYAQCSKDERWRARKVDVFPRLDSQARGEVIWPERKPFSRILELLDEMGTAAFNRRMRNLLEDADSKAFPDDDVDIAFRDDLRFGILPEDARAVLGFDPASGKRTKYTKNPAAVLYAVRPNGDVHIVWWQRMTGWPMPRQLRALRDIARARYVKVAVEDNNQQIAYQDWMLEIAPDVHVVCMTTGDNKRDPDDGVESFVPLFERGVIFFHAAGAPSDEVRAFKREWKDWPQGRYSDLVMASWIAKHQFDLGAAVERKATIQQVVPTYARRYGRRVHQLHKRVG